MAARKTPAKKQTAQQTEANEIDPPQTSLGKADDASHLADVVVPDLDQGEVDEDAPFVPSEEPEVVEAGPEILTKDAFFVVFKTAFSVPGMIAPTLAPVAIQTNEEQPARAASDATYSLLEIYYPAALTPQSETIGHLIVAAPFFVGKALIVREILRARRAPPPPPPQDEQAETGGAVVIHQETPDTSIADNWERRS